MWKNNFINTTTKGAAMSIIKLTDSVYYLPFDPEFDRPSLGYIIGANYGLVVDSGNSPAHYMEFCKQLQSAGFKEPDFCAITHWHWDHTFGMTAINKPIIAHTLTNQKLNEMKLWQWSEAALDERVRDNIEIEFCALHMRKEYSDLSEIKVKLADICFDGSYTVELGNKEVQLIHVEASHCDDAVVVYIPDEKIVFLGDIYSEDYYNNMEVYPQKNKALLDFLCGLDFELGLHSHVIPQTKAEILEILQTMQMACEGL